MMKIYKQTLKITSTQLIHLQKDATVLSAQMQYGHLCVWYRCDVEAESILRNIHIYGTGEPCDGSLHLDFIATVQAGSFVWHVFMDRV